MDTSQPDNQDQAPQEEHETHKAALIFLVLAVFIICYVILTWSGDIDNIGEDPQSDTSTTTEETADPLPENRTNGSIVPVNKISATDAVDTSDLPAGIFVDESGIVRNTSSDIGDDGQTQRIVIFDTEDSVAALLSQYESWLVDSDFRLEDKQEGGTSATLVAAGAGDLIIAVMDTDDGSRVQLNYVTPAN